MNAPHEATELFAEDGVRVTPSWFTIDGESHAMRTVVRLSLVERRVSRGSWTLLFYVSLPLIVLAALAFARDDMPRALAFALFACSIALALTAARYAFVARDLLRLEVTLGNGTQLTVERPGRAWLTRLHAALTRAMDWHHADDGERRAPASQADESQSR